MWRCDSKNRERESITEINKGTVDIKVTRIKNKKAIDRSKNLGHLQRLIKSKETLEV